MKTNGHISRKKKIEGHWKNYHNKIEIDQHSATAR